MVASYCVLEFGWRKRVCNERLAKVKVEGDGVNEEARKIMKAQMSDGGNPALNVGQNGA